MPIIKTTWLAVGLLLLCSACRPEPTLDISQIKAVSQLASLEVKLNKVLFAKQEKKLLPIFFGGITLSEPSFIAHTQATALIGVDLDKLQSKDISVEGRRIRLHLPAVELLDFSYPAATFQEDTIYNPKSNFSVADKERVYQMGELEIRSSLPYLDLTDKAERKIVALLHPLLADLGFEEIEIDFQLDESSQLAKANGVALRTDMESELAAQAE